MHNRLAAVGVLLAVAACSPPPDGTFELRNLGLAQLENEAPSEAEVTYRELTRRLPEEPLGHANLAIALLRQQRLEEALGSIEIALSHAPERPDLLAIKGTILSFADRRDEALETLSRAVDGDPANLETIYALYEQATIGRGAEAEAATTRALALLADLRPENLFVLLKKGRRAIEDGDRAEASMSYLRVRELLWQAPPVAVEQLQTLLTTLEENDLVAARRPATILENVLRGEGIYRNSLAELHTNVQGLPVERFVGEPSAKSFGEAIEARFSALRMADSPGGAVVLADLDTDGRTDIVRLADEGGAARLEVRLAALDFDLALTLEAAAATRLAVADLDNDGTLDLLAFDGGTSWWRGDGRGGFEDHTAELGLDRLDTTAIGILDFDIEGDLDLVAASAGTGDLSLFRNRLEGPLEAIGTSPFPPLQLSSVSAIVPTDIDRDGDLDLLLAHGAGLTLLRNLRQGRFADHTAELGLTVNGRPLVDVASGDLDNDGRLDIVAVGDGIAAWHNDGEVLQSWPLDGVAAASRDYRSVSLFDANNDGRLDLLVTTADAVEVLMQQDDGRFASVDIDAPPAALSTDSGDLDQDGDLDIVTSGADGLHRLENIGGNANHWMTVSLRGLDVGDGKNNHFGIGATIEIRQGDAYQLREVEAASTHIGLGSRQRADLLKVTWTNGVPQNRIDPETNQSVVEEQVLKGSCPFVYTWNGEAVEFVTDCLWGAPLGMPIGGGAWAGADPRELVEITGASPRDGFWDLRITEELWEAAYFDHVRLWIVDHPQDLEIASTNRIIPGGSVDDRIVATAAVRPMAAAWDGRGRDVTERVRKRDEIYADGYPVGRYQGVAAVPWTFTFDLGAAPVAPIRLLLDGWIFPADASLNLAVDQRSEAPTLTRLEALTDKGWQVLMPSMGHPAGKTKTMVIDIPALPTGASRLRIVTSKWLSWDRLAWSVEKRDDAPLVRARLEPLTAELHYRGFSRLVRSAPNAPHRYTYSEVRKESPWLPLKGNYTRYGDVRELLATADDRSVILAAGDELRLLFDASSLPPPEAGWRRTLFLESHGWDKDADRNTWAADSVEPLPFRAMSGYPYAADESFPQTEAMRDYREQWLTRYVGPRSAVSPSATGGQ